MSTAHRPTFHPAVGSSNPGGFRYNAPRQVVHSKDQQAHVALKYRHSQPASTATDDAKQQLEDREDRARADRKRHRGDNEHDSGEASSSSDSTSKRSTQLLLTSGSEKSEESEPPIKLDTSAVDLSAFDDADAVLSDRERDGSDDDADDTSDDEAELQRELDKIKREREAERKRKADDDAAAALAANTALLANNPLLAAGTAPFTTKRRWDDDVVFKNQSRADVTEKVPKRFINDSIRNDFHRSFMKRYVR